MINRALFKLVLTVTLGFGALAPLGDGFELSAIAVADTATPTTRNSDSTQEPVPVTDRIPWLIYVVLTSSTVALAWILFSLARHSRKQSRPANQSHPETMADK